MGKWLSRPVARSGAPALWGDLATEVAAFLPILLAAGFWLGPEGGLIAALSALPFLLLRMILRSGRPGLSSEFRDPISGLPLRLAAVLRLDTLLRDADLSGRAIACLVVGVDEADRLVQRYGQQAHDQLLRSIADRLLSTLRPDDLVARLEGDRFAVVLDPGRRTDLETLVQISARLQASLADPLSIGAMTLHLTLSIGFCPDGRALERTGEAMLTAAEPAMEDARRNGPAAIRAFSPEVAAAARDRSALQERLEQAFDRGEIVAWFQPQLSTDTGAVSGFEALARWKHPDRGLLPPADFLGAVQAGGLSGRLSEAMLYQSLSALRTWHRAGFAIPSVAVNFGKDDLRNPRLSERLQWELDRFDLNPRHLTVEILESVVAEADNDTIVQTIGALSAMGCGVDLDDFGTGHASITSIRRFAVNRIKIDRSFVTHVDSDANQQKMVAAILSMAERLGLSTLAEGVETLAEHSMLSQLGCGHVQGYAIARPMPFEDTVGWLDGHRNRLAPPPPVGRRAS